MTSTRARFAATAITGLVCAIALTRATAGCLDITPIVVPEREAGEVVAGEPCLTCLRDRCMDTIRTCSGNPRCQPVYQCIADLGCLDRRLFDDKISCVLPCLQEGGVLSTADPTVDLLIAVVQCGQGKCNGECNLGDGGVGGVDIDAF